MGIQDEGAFADDVARDAFLYGYSIDEAYTFLFETTIRKGLPLNEFQRLRDLADDTYTAHPSINNDTLHLQGWLDVAAELVVITVPDADSGRYWILHTMDLGHYTTSMIGSRTRGTTGGAFLFAGVGWDGDVPAGVDEVVRSESNLVKVMGRIMTVGGDDLDAARELMDQWRLETLSTYLGQSAPAPVVREFLDPSSTSWVERVNAVLADGTMADADSAWLAQYSEIGLAPGKMDFTPEQVEAAARGQRLGMQHIVDLAPQMTDSARLLGTRAELQDDPRELFAEGTYLGQWGLPPVESVYLKIDTGADGLPLNASGGKRYRARFDAPDVSEFWSFTVYSSDTRLMVHNTIGRHSRGDRTMTAGPDGSYTLELGTVTERSADDPDFLPIPEAETYLLLRLYGPSEAIREGDFTPPVFEVIPEID